MDISKAAGAAAPNPAAEGPKAGGTGGAGAPERRFADVLDQGGGANTQGAHHPQHASAAQFTAPILDPGLDGRVRAGGVGQQHRAHEVSRRPTIELTGERAGNVPTDPSRPSSFQQIAESTMKAESRMDAMIQAARNGKSFSASELLALQVEVFRYSQTVEVISHSTDKLVGAVKQTLGTQV